VTRVLAVEDEPPTVRLGGHLIDLEAKAVAPPIHLTTARWRLPVDPGRPRHLVTEPGMGYRFEP